MSLRVSVATALLLGSCDSPGAEVNRSTDTPAAVVEIAREPFQAFPTAASVRLFVSELGPEGPFLERAGRELTREQLAAIEATFSVVTYSGGPVDAVACYIPHHFLRYLDDDGRTVGEVAVCFCCKEARVEPDNLQNRPNVVLDFDDGRLKAQIEALGLPTEIGCPPN